jgi:hypothetical protein
MSKWAIESATLFYDYQGAPINSDNATGYVTQLRTFVKRRFEVTVYKEGYITTPTTADIIANSVLIFSNGESSERNFPSLLPGYSGTEFIDYIKFDNGGSWKIGNVLRSFNTVTSVWTTRVTLSGSYDVWKRAAISTSYQEYT